MADNENAAELDLLTGAPALRPLAPAGGRALVFGAVVIALVVAIVALAAYLSIVNKQAQFQAEIRQRMEILAHGRAEVIATWLDGTSRVADRVVASDLFRLFAAEIDAAQDIGASLPKPLLQQIPYMNQVLSEFARNVDFLSAHLVGRNGRAYVTSAAAAPLTAEQLARVTDALATGRPAFGPVVAKTQGLAMDLYAPLFPPQAVPGDSGAVGVMVLGLPLNVPLGQFLALQPLARPGEEIRLLQRTGDSVQEIKPGAVRPVDATGLFDAGRAVIFALRRALDGERTVYSAGAAVAGIDWWVVQEAEAGAARAELRAFTAAAIAGAVLVATTMIAVFGVVWWRLASVHNRALAEQFRQLAGRIGAQKRLLDSINNAIVEYIGLKNRNGAYKYVNPAFAAAVGKPLDQLIDQDDRAIFGQGTAARLKITDQQAIDTGHPVRSDEEVYMRSRLCHLQVSKVPLRDAHGAIAGIVSVARDVTELVEQQKRRERAIKQTVAALVRAIELRDPYLAGHSRRLAGFATATARQMGLSANDIDTLEIAANLSQIGKLAIDVALLAKPDRLTPDEIQRMQAHVEHAVTVLREIDFDLPVLESIYQMHERLDGKGYPRGLPAERIIGTARILGACDVFCARVVPRAYRGAISPDAALAILRENAARYDSTVIAALSEVARSVAGEKLLRETVG